MRAAGSIPPTSGPELPKDDFVKRIVGLPGDRVEVRAGGRVWIDGRAIRQTSEDRRFADENGRSLDVRVEELQECDHLVLDDPSRTGQTIASFTVPDGRYFMMGDNRDNSNDSRKWGTVHLDDFKGPAFVLYWSWDHNGNFLAFFNPVNWFSIEKRWDRLGKRVRCGDLEAPDRAGAASSAPSGPLQNRG